MYNLYLTNNGHKTFQKHHAIYYDYLKYQSNQKFFQITRLDSHYPVQEERSRHHSVQEFYLWIFLFQNNESVGVDKQVLILIFCHQCMDVFTWSLENCILQILINC